MEEWNKVAVQKDVDKLLHICGRFHDTCIVSVNYKSGAFVDEKNAMHFGACDDHELSVVLHGQWEPRGIELCFIGVRQFHLTGWRSNYTCEILEAHLSFYEGMWEGKQERLIVWSDVWDFNIDQLSGAAKELKNTYVIASALKWRAVTGDS